MHRRAASVLLLLAALTPGVPPCDGAEALNREYLPALAARFGFPRVLVRGETVRLSNPSNTMDFTVYSRKLVLNDVLLWMNDAVAKNDGAWTIHDVDVSTMVEPLVLQRRTALLAGPVQRVLLDPGHGGEDGGAVGLSGVVESAGVLDIARRVRKRLKSTGLAAALTHDKDYQVSLLDRSEIARQRKADLFVSIHLNAIPNRVATGLETYAMTPAGFASTTPGRTDARQYPGNAFDPQNVLLAYCIHKAVLSSTGSADRGVKHARFEVLQNAPCPAVLVECGFVSSPKDAARLATEAHREAMADGIARGIVSYANLSRKPKPEQK